MNFKSSRNAKISNLLMKKFNLLVEQEEGIMSTDEILAIVGEAQSLLGEDNIRAKNLQKQASRELKKGRNAGSTTHINLYNDFGKAEGNNFLKGVAMRATNIPRDIKQEINIGGESFPWTGDSKGRNFRKFAYLATTGQLPFESWASFEAGFEDVRGGEALANLGTTMGTRNRAAAKAAKAVVDEELEKRGRIGVYGADGRLIGVERITGEAKMGEAWDKFRASSQWSGALKFAAGEWPSDEVLERASRTKNKKIADEVKKVQAAKAQAIAERDRIGQYKSLGIDDVFSGSGTLQDPDKLEAKLSGPNPGMGGTVGNNIPLTIIKGMITGWTDVNRLPENEKKALEIYAKRNRMRYEALKNDFDNSNYVHKETGEKLTFDQRLKAYNENIMGQKKKENKNMANYFNNFYNQQFANQRHPSSVTQGEVDVSTFGMSEREANLPVLRSISANRGTQANVIDLIGTKDYPHPIDFTDSGINDHTATATSQGWNSPIDFADVKQAELNIKNYNSEDNIGAIDSRRSQAEIEQFRSDERFQDGALDDTEPEIKNIPAKKEPEELPMAPFQEALIRKVVQEALKRKFGE